MEDFDLVIKALDGFEEQIRIETPALAQLLSDAKAKRISSAEATRWLMSISKEDEQARAILQKATERFLPSQVVTKNPTSQRPRLNPLVEAALVERAQIDGDIPELRTGPLPRGMLPSMPVNTKAKNPVVVGQMLATAAQTAQKQIEQHEGQRLQAIAASTGGLQLVAKHGALVTKRGQALGKAISGSAATDHSDYRRGQLPARMTVPTPSGAEIAATQRKEALEATWAAVATSQGRRSVTPIIQEGIAQKLTRFGFEISTRDPKEGNEIPQAMALWSISIAGRESLQPGFSFFDVAAMALTTGLLGKLKEKTPRPLFLEVAPLLQVDDRTVGWYGKLYEKDVG